MTPARVLFLGGVDPSGGAGLTTDARMAHELGVHPLPVVTCITVQNGHGFAGAEPVDASLVVRCLRAAVGDGVVGAIKLGLIGNASLLQDLFEEISQALPAVPVVVDPVLSATSGGLAVGDEMVAAYRKHLGSITVLTPNLPELARFGGVPEELVRAGCRHVFVTGGHGDGDVVEDRLHTADGVVTMRHPRLDCGPVRGTGCALAASVASRLARGDVVEAACRGAVEDLAASLQQTGRSPEGLPVPLAITASRSSD